MEKERKAAKIIVDEENANHANEFGYHIDLVGWEDTVSQRQRAQDAINIDLDQCEYFVGMLWKRWGTPPGLSGHPYTSGFEEEYRRSVDRHDSTRKPEISLLFKNIPSDFLEDIGPQRERVLQFRNEISSEKKQHYQEFKDLREFEQKFRAIISKFLRDQHNEDANSEARDSQKPSLTKRKDKDQQRSAETRHIFEEGMRVFLGDFLDKEDVDIPYSSEEAARFRLIASTVSQSGNDILVLGTHDANLIYRHLRKVVLSKREKRALVSAGLENLESYTIPLWHWLFDKDVEIRSELPFLSISGTDRKRRNAFRILAKLSIAPKDFLGNFDNLDYIDFWFSKYVSDDLIVAALEYLGAVGDDEIEVDWAKLTGSSEANIARAAVRASTRITARTNTAAALRFVAQHDSVDLGKELATELLTNISTIETEVLQSCLKNRTRTFLKAVATELSNRDALTKTDAQLLCESTDAEIRLIGVNALKQLGPTLSMSDASKLLVKPRKTDSFAFSPLSQDNDEPGRNAFMEFKIGVLSELSYGDLLELQKDESFYSTETSLAIYSSHFRKVKIQLEKDLLDGFKSFCAGRRVPLLGTSSEPPASIFRFVQDGLLQSALETFCAKAVKSDLATVRKVVDEYEIKFAAEIVEFLAKHGEWEDAIRIAKLSGNFKTALSLSLLSIVDHSNEYRQAARAIIKLSSKRIADAWKLELSTSARVQLVVAMPKNLFAAFDDQSIVDMLVTESDVVREAVAQKAVLCLTKSRLSKVLSAYYSVEGTYYYNAIFWLDLGISANRATSKTVALNELMAK